MTHRTDSEILEKAAEVMAPLIILFGCYLIGYGRLSPGGGFQGGVTMASGVLLLLLSRGVPGGSDFPIHRKSLHLVEAAAFMLFLFSGVATLGFGREFLVPAVPDGTGSPALIFLLNIIIGLKVGAGISLVGYAFISHRRES